MSKYVTNISQRTSADITIKRKVQGSGDVVQKTVPITARSMRKFKLMQEDYIQLEFSLADAFNFQIGDYIDDPIFGKYVISEEQMPKYNQTTGGYDYSLRFDADYWQMMIHHLHTLVKYSALNALTTQIVSGVTYAIASSNSNVFTRMEANWSLTDRLLVHAEQVLCNIKAIYNGYNYLVAVHPSATKAAEAKCIPYNGMSIMAALNKIAEEYECEWWVTKEVVSAISDATQTIIHFGKCEYGSDSSAYEMTLGNNVEMMDIARDQQTFANRIFAYGGTKNIPEDYDRGLTFMCDFVSGTGENLVMWDSHRKLTDKMINDTVNGESTIVSEGKITDWVFHVDQIDFLKGTISPQSYSEDTYRIRGSIRLEFGYSGSGTIKRVKFTLYHGSKEIGSVYASKRGLLWMGEILISDYVTSSPSFTVIASYNSASFIDDAMVAIDCEPMLTGISTTGSTASKRIEIVINGSTHTAVLNPLNVSESDPRYSYIGKIMRKGGSSYVDISVGQSFTFQSNAYLNKLEIPYSYYTPSYSTGVMSKVGERRLHLAGNTRYVQTSGLNHLSKVVEETVIFEDVFPRLQLKIAYVETEPKEEDIVHDDGSVEHQSWTQYKFTAVRSDDSEFVFNIKYIMDGNKLQACFTTPTTIPQSGFMLAGMTFEVGFDNSTQMYTIIRNDDFGAQIPNSYLYPSEGDTFFLTGWNPKAITELDLVSDAASELSTKATEYLNALKDGQFTFTSRMMSNIMTAYPFRTDSSDKTKFGLLDAGAKVKVVHASMPGGYKISRVIGCEYKLDMPFDTPTYIIGETEAYSRLKQIEKQLKKL